MFRHAIRSTGVTVALVAVGLTQTAPASATDPAPTRPAPVVVPASDLGIDASSASAPWRAVETKDGSVHLTWGNTGKVPVEADAVAVAKGAGQSAPAKVSPEAAAAALSWWCDVYTSFDTVRDGSTLRTAYDVSCHNVARHRVNWKFQRSSWSGYRDYSVSHTGGWVSVVNNSQTIRAACGSGGTYDYHAAVASQAQPTIGDTRTSPTYFTKKGRHTCGTGVS
jgi:hypothetical protein